jgi:hypothetical protein
MQHGEKSHRVMEMNLGFNCSVEGVTKPAYVSFSSATPNVQLKHRFQPLNPGRLQGRVGEPGNNSSGRRVESPRPEL